MTDPDRADPEGRDPALDNDLDYGYDAARREPALALPGSSPGLLSDAKRRAEVMAELLAGDDEATPADPPA